MGSQEVSSWAFKILYYVAFGNAGGSNHVPALETVQNTSFCLPYLFL